MATANTFALRLFLGLFIEPSFHPSLSMLERHTPAKTASTIASMRAALGTGSFDKDKKILQIQFLNFRVLPSTITYNRIPSV